VRNYAFIYPEGYRERRTGGRVPEEGTVLSVGVVSYVCGRDQEVPTVYLDPATPKPQQVVTFEVDGAQYSLSLGETAQLSDHLRRISEGSVGPATTAAVGIERLIEDAGSNDQSSAVGSTEFFESEKTAMQTAIEIWRMQVGATGLPTRVLHLFTALRREAENSHPDEPLNAA
jgi:hypothetical protein